MNTVLPNIIQQSKFANTASHYPKRYSKLFLNVKPSEQPMTDNLLSNATTLSSQRNIPIGNKTPVRCYNTEDNSIIKRAMTQDRSRKYSIDVTKKSINSNLNGTGNETTGKTHVHTLSTFSNQHTKTNSNNISNTPNRHNRNDSSNSPLIIVPPTKKTFRNSISGTIPNQDLSLKNNITNENHIFTFDHFDRVFNPKPKKKPKHNPFEVTEEDKIFNELQLHKKVKKKPKKLKIILSRNEKILSHVYQLSRKSQNDIVKAKKKKKVLPLKQYQSHLLTTASAHLSRDAVKQLGKTFTKIRNICNGRQYEYNYEAVRELEDDEERVIMDIHRAEDAFRNLLNGVNEDNDEKSFGVLMLNLPKVPFTRVIKRSMD